MSGVRDRRRRLRLLLLAITSLGAITLDLRGASAVEGARATVARVLAPVQRAADTATDPFRDAWRGVNELEEIEAENRRLRAELRELRAEPAAANLAESQLASILAAQELTVPSHLERRLARVVSGPRSNFSHDIEIDQGSGDGIAVGMPVVVGAGLVGRVQQVTASTSLVRLLTDPDLRVGVKVPDGPFGTARGTGDRRRLIVDTSLDTGLPPDDGTLVVTSGDPRSTYPPWIPVGVVRGSRQADNGLTIDLVVEPLAELRRLDAVTVLLTAPSG